MAGWQKAGDFRACSRAPRACRRSQPAPVGNGGYPAASRSSVDFSIWALLGRALLFLSVSVGWIPDLDGDEFYRWFIERCAYRSGPIWLSASGRHLVCVRDPKGFALPGFSDS